MFDKEKFEECLKIAGITKKALAEKLNINESTLYRKINGNGDFDRSEMSVIVEALGIGNPMEIFFADKLA